MVIQVSLYKSDIGLSEVFMRNVFLFLLFLFFLTVPAAASIEVALKGEQPVVVDEVYHRNGQVYIAIDDLLQALGMDGGWDAVEHVYRIKSYRGTAIISPGSRFMRIGEQFIPLQVKPRFIDNRLRVTEGFVLKHLSSLHAEQFFYRNLAPSKSQSSGEDSAMDRLFSFMVKKKKPADADILRAVAIDPGHGGHDPGAIGLDGLKEKDVNLGVALSLQKLIKMNLGVPVFLSRDADYGLSLEEHLKPALEPDVDVLLLLHAQTAFTPDPSGIYIYIRNDVDMHGDTESLRLANNLAVALREEGLTVHDVLEAPLLPLGRGDLPTVLVEMGFLSHPEESVQLADKEGQLRLATGLYNGLSTFAKGEKGL